MNEQPEPLCAYCHCPIDICDIGACPGRFAREGNSNMDFSQDWTRWEDERLRGYLLRLVSQAVWLAGERAELLGRRARGKLWDLSDWILEIAHPTPEPVDIDLT